MKTRVKRKKLLTFSWLLAFWMLILVTLAGLNPLHAGDDIDFVTDQVVVKLNPAGGATIAAINASYNTTTLQMLLGSANIYLLQIAPGAEVEDVVEAMTGDSRLLYAEPNFLGEMPEGDPSDRWAWGGHDPQPYLDQYAADMLNLDQAHAATLGAGVVVAVLDTGVQLDHPRLAGRLTTNGYDFVDDDAVPEDEPNGLDDDGNNQFDEGAGHGTHVAGIINLVAPEAQIMPLRVLDSDGGGNVFQIAEAVQYAVANGAGVINLSLGTPAESELLDDVVQEALAAGVIVVAAAGNLNSTEPQYPAADEHVLGVTSVGPAYLKSPFANYGSWVGIAAPGQSITSTFPIDGYARWSGTSMSTPFISGQAALIRSLMPAAPVAEVTWFIQATARPLDSFNPGYPGLLGAGLADIGASLSLASSQDCGPAVSVYAVADAWLQQGSPSSNKGSDAVLKVKSQGSNDNFRALIRFALPVNMPAGCVVESAALRLYAASSTGGRTLQALRLSGDWAESGVTWNNQPPAAGGVATVASGQGYREWNVTAQVQAMFDGSANYGFLIRDADENSSGAEQQFHSREKGEHPPVLVLQFAAAAPSDALAPETTVVSGPDALTTSDSATFTFSASEPGSTFACSLDGTAFTACPNPQLYTALSPGSHTFRVRATDPAGNTDPTPAVYSWTIALTPVPAAVSCGQVLTVSVLLTNSLINCPGDGLVIGANGVIVDLNGHTIDGVDLGAGIRNNGFDGVSVSNGRIQQFDFGVQLNPGTRLNTIASLQVADNRQAGIWLSGAGSSAGGNQLLANVLIGNGDAIVLRDGTRGTLVQGNTIGAGSNAGLIVENSSGNHIEGNVFEGSSNTSLFLQGASGNSLINNSITGSADLAIELRAASHGNRVEGNAITDGGDGGIFVEDSDNNELIANVVHYVSDSGIGLDNAHNTIVRGNDLRFNGGGIELSASTGNLVEANNTSDSSGAGIEVDSGSLGNVIRLNTANNNTAEGITIEAEILPGITIELGNLLESNTTSGNQGNGIYVARAGHTLTANRADDNDAWGIYAPEGAIDGGGNSASGNSELLQCFNISCNGGGHEPPPPPPPPSPPDTIIFERPPNPSSSASATFTFAGLIDDDEEPSFELAFECRLDGQADFAGCQNPQTYSNLSPGIHTFEVRAVDLLGNIDPTPASYTWAISPPVDCGAPITVYANADAWIDQGSRTSNKGSDSILKVQGKNNNNFRALVRFNQPVSLLAGCVVESATLRLYAASWKTGRTIQVLQVAGAWTENGVTWNNQPGTVGPAATAASGSGWRQWNVTAQLQAMYTAGANYGFLIRDATETGGGSEQQFHAREKGENVPRLIITFAPAG